MPTDDLFAPEQHQPTAKAKSYVLCEFDDTALAIPQGDVAAIEHGGELVAPMPGEAALGWFASSKGPWPVFAMNKRLSLTTAPTGMRSFVVFLAMEPLPLGLLVQSVRIIGDVAELSMQHVPAPLAAYAKGVEGVSRVAGAHLTYVFATGGLTGLIEQKMTSREVHHG